LTRRGPPAAATNAGTHQHHHHRPMTTTTPKRWRLVSYHPTWGEDWRHFATYYDAIQARARLLALPSDGTAYTIEPCQEAGR
jgi:hypothetical protein